ncbi:MAG: RNA polymerase sigma factor [Nocardioides sp.]|uniref:RNA polymerase sigma factor n=1 Tax=Nocardioides sp. TaxID=35761 RepID=UPI0039E6CC86
MTGSQATGPTDDRELLGRATQGDQSALGVLYDRHVRAVYAQALGVTGDANTAEDVTQDVFITFWEKARGVRLVDTSVLPWLMVTAKFHGLNAGRRLRRERSHTTPMHDEPGVEDHVLRAEIQAEIARAVGALSDIDRRVYEMCLDGEHTYESAALTLGLSHASVRNRLSRVRLRLRADLQALRES